MGSKAIAGGIGTFIPVFFGLAGAVLTGDKSGFRDIAMAFALSIVTACSLGAIPEAQLNPAVSPGLLAAAGCASATSSPE